MKRSDEDQKRLDFIRRLRTETTGGGESSFAFLIRLIDSLEEDNKNLRMVLYGRNYPDGPVRKSLTLGEPRPYDPEVIVKEDSKNIFEQMGGETWSESTCTLSTSAGESNNWTAHIHNSWDGERHVPTLVSVDPAIGGAFMGVMEEPKEDITDGPGISPGRVEETLSWDEWLGAPDPRKSSPLVELLPQQKEIIKDLVGEDELKKVFSSVLHVVDPRKFSPRVKGQTFSEWCKENGARQPDLDEMINAFDTPRIREEALSRVAGQIQQAARKGLLQELREAYANGPRIMPPITKEYDGAKTCRKVMNVVAKDDPNVKMLFVFDEAELVDPKVMEAAEKMGAKINSQLIYAASIANDGLLESKIAPGLPPPGSPWNSVPVVYEESKESVMVDGGLLEIDLEQLKKTYKGLEEGKLPWNKKLTKEERDRLLASWEQVEPQRPDDGMPEPIVVERKP